MRDGRLGSGSSALGRTGAATWRAAAVGTEGAPAGGGASWSVTADRCGSERTAGGFAMPSEPRATRGSFGTGGGVPGRAGSGGGTALGVRTSSGTGRVADVITEADRSLDTAAITSVSPSVWSGTVWVSSEALLAPGDPKLASRMRSDGTSRVASS
jgi:hypothetical protein